MVKTRRSEVHPTRHHRTRGSAKLLERDSGSSSAKEEEESDTDHSNSEGETSSNSPLAKTKEQLKRKQAERQSEVASIDRKFKTKFESASSSSSKTAHKSIPLVRKRLAVYATRKMEDDLSENDQFSDDECYSNLRSRRHSKLVKKKNILRRTALSLRPLRQKSYADLSPIHFETDSDGPLRKVTRRSRKIEGSWLADSQMHKVGYPNLNVTYSEEEDSRDAVEGHANVEISQNATRHSRRRLVKPTYYYEEYEEVPQIRRTRRPVRRVVREVEEDSKIARTRTSRTEQVKEEPVEAIIEDSGSKSSKENKEEPEDTKEVVENGAEDKVQEEISGSEEDEVQPRQIPRTRRNRRTRMRINSDREKETDTSSEEDEGGRKYSLRDRASKPTQKIMQTSMLRPQRERRSRRRFNRRRKSSSDSSSSSSSSERCRKQPKSPHSKKEMMKTGAGGRNAIVPIKPETLDQSVRFNSIGGLDSHIECLKEMILLPMMYPEVFRQFQVQPPRGVLFHGPPGTGKTLISRALANECSFGARKVSFFMRKGADLLSKWIGEAEKQLRLLFEQAAEMKPSIIFFDELDGLTPTRSSRQDQVHASIVSTLLALMDGLNDRGEVIVIGATNRIDAIDPALRRPGRFDRELFFPLPSKTEREDILKVHISKWVQPPSDDLQKYLAENTVGYCGSDLRALCSEAVIQSFRRTYPQVYDSEQRLLLDPSKVMVEKIDFLRAKSMLIPSSHRMSSGLGKKLIPILEPLLGCAIKSSLGALEQGFPHGLNTALSKVKLSTNLKPAQLLLTGDGPQHGQSNHVAPALLFRMEHIHSYLLDLATLFRDPGRTPEEVCIQIFNEARRNVPSIIYIPSINRLWELVSDTFRAIFLSQMNEIYPNIPILFLVTADVVYNELPEPLQEVFSPYRKEIQEVRPPSTDSRRQFFKSLLLDICLRPLRPVRERPKTPPPLPRAPTPPPPPLTEEQAQKVYDTEEHTLRELRIFLRDMCKKLANNKLFFMFTKPVDTEEVPDYTEIIKQPMDLETMMMKVDFHRYECAKDFLIDIDLICQNALEYNPAKTSADKQIRHRACSLRDYAYTLIKTEMDSDFEDKCQDIKKKRKQRNACTTKYLPPYMLTPENAGRNLNIDLKQDQTANGSNSRSTRHSPVRKRKLRVNWKNGYVRKKPKRAKLDTSLQSSMSKTEKHSSDESKNDPDSSTMEIPQLQESDSNKTSESSSALSSNCDSQKVISSSHSSSGKKITNDLLSPSELLDSQVCFDEIDQALHENDDAAAKQIECSETELEKLLEQIVKFTEEFPLNQLLDLYNQLNSIIKKFAQTHLRNSLPKELTKEFTRFKKALNADSSSSSPNTSKEN
ncbi:ATPase family AAA domain-containing protein 2-like isoform X2 [Euwallacea fornicatus]|uniref:ATPase family AAA domain-containing protein 2-like isoform X2 n=1 Tax=Euwallacea fornicatus TaxID=995702 RepID=UPI00338E2361